MHSQDTISTRSLSRGSVLRTCEHCHKTFKVRPYRDRVIPARFCSGGCVSLAKRVAYIDALHASDTDLAYFAGMIDGEGSITIIKSTEGRAPAPRYRLRLYITNISLPLMEWLKATFGGRVHHRLADSGKTVYHWCSADSAVETLIRAALPFLRVKAEQARLALDFRPDPSAFSSRHLSGNEIERRERIWLAISTLNAAGGRVRVLHYGSGSIPCESAAPRA